MSLAPDMYTRPLPTQVPSSLAAYTAPASATYAGPANASRPHCRFVKPWIMDPRNLTCTRARARAHVPVPSDAYHSVERPVP